MKISKIKNELYFIYHTIKSARTDRIWWKLSAYNGHYLSTFLFRNLENITHTPPMPVDCIGFDRLLSPIPAPILLDYILTFVGDNDKVMVSKSALKSLIDVYDNLVPEEEIESMTFGAYSSVKKEIKNTEIFNKQLEDSRNKGLHW